MSSTKNSPAATIRHAKELVGRLHSTDSAEDVEVRQAVAKCGHALFTTQHRVNRLSALMLAVADELERGWAEDDVLQMLARDLRAQARESGNA